MQCQKGRVEWQQPRLTGSVLDWLWMLSLLVLQPQKADLKGNRVLEGDTRKMVPRGGGGMEGTTVSPMCSLMTGMSLDIHLVFIIVITNTDTPLRLSARASTVLPPGCLHRRLQL